MTGDSVRTLVRGAWLMTMAGDDDLIGDGAVAVGEGGAIVATGSFEELSSIYPGAEVVGDGNGIVMPGMVNAHTHLTECLIPGMGEDAVLYEWFERVVNPTGLVINRDEVALGTRLKGAEMLASGITCVSDMSCHRNMGSLATLGAVDGLVASGLRGVVSFGAEDLFDNAPGPEAFIAEHEALADRISGEELIDFRCGIGTVMGMSDQLFAATISACRQNDWAVHTHLSEVREELTASRLAHKATTIEHSHREGLFEVPVLAAHCIWCTERDIGLLRDSQVSVVHNPVANMLLGNGVCPVPRLRREGITVALGTDGPASNDNQDMFGVLKAAGLLHKVNTMDPTVIRARDIVSMATIEGARALGLEDTIGSLEPGKRADLVLLDGNTPELATIHDPWQQLVYCATARCVSDVWVDGERRVEGGRVSGVNMVELAREAREAAIDLVRRAGLTESVYV